MNKVVRKYLFNEEHPLRVKGRQNTRRPANLVLLLVAICLVPSPRKCIQKGEEDNIDQNKSKIYRHFSRVYIQNPSRPIQD